MAIIRDVATGRGPTINLIDPRKIKVMPRLNARDMASVETQAHIAMLADSIEAQGFLGSHPLEVFSDGDDIYVAAGHCRLAAVMALIERGVEILAVPCLSEARHTSREQRLLNQIVSNVGKRLSPSEEGRVYAQLISYGWTHAVIAKRVGKSETHIRHAIDFTAAPTEAHQLVSSGKVSATLAAKTIRQEGAKKGVAKLNAAVKRATKEGKAKATARHIDRPAPAANDPAPACVALVKRMAAETDANSLDEASAANRFLDLIAEAQKIFSHELVGAE